MAAIYNLNTARPGTSDVGRRTLEGRLYETNGEGDGLGDGLHGGFGFGTVR